MINPARSRPALRLMSLSALLLATGCDRTGQARLGQDEVLVQVSATAEAEARPNVAEFSAGMSSIAASAGAASQANARTMAAVTASLTKLGVAEADLQTRDIGLQRIEYGPNRGRFEARNTLNVRMRDVAKAGAAVAAATEAGANILSGPALSVGDPEAATRDAYAAAYKAARARAGAYASAAGMKVVRVLTIRDAGRIAEPSPYGDTVLLQAESVAPPPVVAPPVMAGTNRGSVTVSADFALAR